MIILALTLIAFLAFAWQQNHGLMTSRYEVERGRLPDSFEGYTIVQVSDLHDKYFGRGQEKLLRAIAEAGPDLIVLTGDLIDGPEYEPGAALELVKGAAEMAPVYYVSGNHETRQDWYGRALGDLEEAGAHILEDKVVEIRRQGGVIRLAGLAEPGVHGGRIPGDVRDMVGQSAEEGFTLLLSHRPELIELYAQMGVDLVFSGHAHGGQFRIPGLGGLYAPGQGIFPKYTAGIHVLGDTAMAVSRGLGNSVLPLRLFNRPELVVVELHK